MAKKVMTAFAAVFCLIVLAGGPALADDITDQINDALDFYKKGKISEAINELEFAVAQLRQKKAGSLTDIFPDAPSGWKADKAKSQAAGRAMMGGGITASRVYRKSGGGQATIEIVSDSPMLQTLAMVMQNPMFLQGGSQGKLIRIKGNKALLKETTDKRASLQAMLNNGKVLLKVDVSRVDDAANIAKKFARMVDFDKISELTK